MGYSFKSANDGRQWESFSFVSKAKDRFDLAMLWSKMEIDLFETGGSEWAGSWDDVASCISRRCRKNNSRVAFLRLSCHGNVGAFAMGNSIFVESNKDKWMPIVAQISGYFVPGVSFVTIDSCKTGAGDGVLKAFSTALGGVDVRGYEDIQTKSTSEDSGRGAFVTCRVEVCERNPGSR